MLSAAPRASLTPPSCSLNYPSASRIGWTHARHCPFLNCLRFVLCHYVNISFFSLPVSSGTEESDSTSRAYFKTRRQRSDSLCFLPFTSLEESGRCSELTTLYMGRKYEVFFFRVFPHVCFLFLHLLPPDILNLTLGSLSSRNTVTK